MSGPPRGDRPGTLRRWRGRLRRLALDFSPLRDSRDFRLLALGELVSTLGTQVALVALPYQVYVLSHSAALVGLLGAFELGPMIVASLFGGAIADRLDRRNVLFVAQVGIIVTASLLGAITLATRPPVLVILVVGGVLAGSVSLDAVTRAAIVPRVVPAGRLRSALAFNYGSYQLAGIVGPAVGGIVIATIGIGAGYLIDAGSCLAMAVVALALSPQPPERTHSHPPILRSIGEGLRFVRRNQALSGSFAIDLVAMTFGWPRAMLPVLSLTVYHAGARGTGLLFAALAVGGTISVLTAGWIERARRLGRIVIVVVVLWGIAIAGTGLVRAIVPAMLLLAVAGFADGISAVCRSTINQTVTPDDLRGRMSAVYNLVVTGGPRLGDVESGLVAGLTSATTSVLTGGLACILGAVAVVVGFPALERFDGGPVPSAESENAT
ncbi:MAG TPA: MFS transporter [Solirubrobacteraceae bacterium]